MICDSIEKCNDSEWIYSWFYDLKEWEDQSIDLFGNRAWFDLAYHFRFREAAEKVKKIRLKLGDLRTKMVPRLDILTCMTSCIS